MPAIRNASQLVEVEESLGTSLNLLIWVNYCSPPSASASKQATQNIVDASPSGPVCDKTLTHRWERRPRASEAPADSVVKLVNSRLLCNIGAMEQCDEKRCLLGFVLVDGRGLCIILCWARVKGWRNVQTIECRTFRPALGEICAHSTTTVVS